MRLSDECVYIRPLASLEAWRFSMVWHGLDWIGGDDDGSDGGVTMGWALYHYDITISNMTFDLIP